MSKYQKRVEIVDAFKWTGGPDQTEDPLWFIQIMDAGYVWFEQQAKAKGKLFRMRIEFPHLDLTFIAHPGSYIIIDQIGRLNVMAADEFEALYELVGLRIK